MTKIAAALMSASVALACLMAGCASNAPPPRETVTRSSAPRNHEQSITSYFDATVRGIDPSRELVIGTPQRGACPMGGNTGGYVGWVVPVEYKTRSNSGVVSVTSYFFWFSDEIIRGVTRRMEVCP